VAISPDTDAAVSPLLRHCRPGGLNLKLPWVWAGPREFSCVGSPRPDVLRWNLVGPLGLGEARRFRCRIAEPRTSQTQFDSPLPPHAASRNEGDIPLEIRKPGPSPRTTSPPRDVFEQDLDRFVQLRIAAGEEVLDRSNQRQEVSIAVELLARFGSLFL